MESVSRTAELGKYTLVAEIARGGMGVVYLAQVRGPGGFQKMVVVKELKSELGDDPKFRDMFLEEANLAARLNHRNIVQTNEVGSDGSRLFMAMDYLDGCSLHTVHKRLTGARKPTLVMELRVLAEVLAGLHYAHELNDYDGTPLGVVHRDVGPQNIYVTFDGQVKLIDFGVAKVLNRQQETQAGVLKGRVAYMAPEQVGGETIDRRVDIFAAGLLMREVITGKRVWDGLSEIDTLKKLISRQIPAFPEDVEIPAELRDICVKAMAPNRDDRFKTAHEMRVLVEAYLARVDPSGSTAELGSHLARELHAERKRLKDVVDAHQASGGDGSLPALDFPMIAPSSPELSISGASSSARRLVKTPASGTIVAGDVPEPEIPIDAGPLVGKPDRSRFALLGGVVLVAIAIGGVMLLRRGTERPAAVEDRGTSTSAAAAGAQLPQPAANANANPNTQSPPDAEGMVEVTVRVTPAVAQIFVDDVAVQGNPYRARFPRNASATHTVRGSAFGFVSKTELVKFDANASVALSLEHQPVVGGFVAPARAPEARPAEPRGTTSTGAAAASPAPVAATRPAPSDIHPQGGKAPKRDIDPKNPYGAQ